MSNHFELFKLQSQIISDLRKLITKTDNPEILERLINYFSGLINSGTIIDTQIFSYLLKTLCDPSHRSANFECLSDSWIESFHDGLKFGKIELIKLFLKIDPTLARSCNTMGIYSVISALQFADRHNKVNDILKILYGYGADFNHVSSKVSGKLSMLSMLTPLAYCIINMPESRYVIDTLIQYDADVNHLSVANTINMYKSNINELEDYTLNRRSCINYILALQGKNPLPPAYEVNKSSIVNLERQKKIIKSIRLDFTSDLSELFHPRCLVGLRWGIGTTEPKTSPNPNYSLFAYVNVYENNENLYDVINTEIFEFTGTKEKDLVFGILTGEISPFSIYSLLKAICGPKLKYTVLGRFLYLSVGHSNYKSKSCLKIIDNDLIESFAHRIRHHSGSAELIIRKIMNLAGITDLRDLTDLTDRSSYHFPHEIIHDLIDDIPNEITIQNTIAFFKDAKNQKYCDRLPLRISSISFSPTQMKIHKQLCHSQTILDETNLYQQVTDIKETTYCISGIMIERIIAKILLGQQSPDDVNNFFMDILGVDFYETLFGMILCSLLSFVMLDPKTTIKIVDDNLADVLKELYFKEKANL